MNWESWGRYPRLSQTAKALYWQSEAPHLLAEGTYLPVGLGRSYGDVCLSDSGTVMTTKFMNRVIAFDHRSGHIRAEAGIALSDLLKVTLPHGWFLPVTPGTKYVTLGGAVANDVHGKNHHTAGTFGRHVTELVLERSDGRRIVASATNDEPWFRATIGGLGLTGLIVEVSLRLKRVQGPFVSQELIRFRSLDDFSKLTESSDRDWEYTVAWVDAARRSRGLGRGIFIRGNHASKQGKPDIPGPRINIPVQGPEWLLNPWSIRCFNNLYYHRPLKSGLQHFDPFFYPLDVLGHWNRLYGRRGFVQYQCAIDDLDLVGRILAYCAKHKRYSFLSVLKKFGNQPAAGTLSFPMPGYTLTLDLPADPNTLRVLDQLDQWVLDAGGRIYPAKDARMSRDTFKRCFPQWRDMQPFMDPRISSAFWQRVSGEKP